LTEPAANAGSSKYLVVIGTIAGMGGAERQALYLIEELSHRADISVDVLTFQDGTALRPELERLGVPVHVVEYFHLWPRARRVKALARIAKLLRTGIRPDVILPFVGIHSKTMGLVWPYTGARYCWWNQQDEGRDLNGTASERRVLEQASHIVSNSWAGRDFLVETYSLPAEAVIVYNNGTPLPANTSPSGEWRQRGIFKGRPLAAMVANISAYKDHETLLRAWRLVMDGWSDPLKPALILAGSLSDAGQAARMKTLAFDLGLSANDVHFAGAVGDVTSLLADMDLVVHSSVAEGCPNSVCEAMAMGRAVVATDIPGCRQALGDTGGDCYARPHDAEEMAAKTVAFLRDPELRSLVGNQNRARIASEFSVEAMNRFFLDRVSEGLKGAA
jgi:glycosyltransferase involved in cell wall biosynthesis